MSIDRSNKPSRFRRSLQASIFIALAASCFYLMDILSLIRDFPPPSASGYIKWFNATSSGRVRILQNFHCIPFLDEIFRDVTVGFAPSSFGYDDVSRWQMLNFMMDIGVLYVIWGLESERPTARGTAISYPSVLATLAQLGGGGVFVPLYYFFHLVSRPLIGVQNVSERKVELIHAWLWLPLVLIFHTLPTGLIFVAPTFEDRHWWVWFWQLYPVRIALTYHLILGSLFVLPMPAVNWKLSYPKTIVVILAPVIGISASVWLYTLRACPHPLTSVFFPSAFFPSALLHDTWPARMRRILQFDQLFVYGSSMLWLSWLVVYMRKANEVTLSQMFTICVVALVGTVLGGPGAAFGVTWLWKECWPLEERQVMKKKA